MQQRPSLSTKNRILSRLSDDDAALLKPDLVPVELALRQVLEQPTKPIQHAYFIEYGLASIVAANGHKRLEVGLIGCEGMTGLPSYSAMTDRPTKPSCRSQAMDNASPPISCVRR